MDLLLITRSNLDAHEFCDIHNLDYSSIIVIKSLGDLVGLPQMNYVVIAPGPRGFHQYIRPYLILNGFKNITRYYNNKLTKF